MVWLILWGYPISVNLDHQLKGHDRLPDLHPPRSGSLREDGGLDKTHPATIRPGGEQAK